MSSAQLKAAASLGRVADSLAGGGKLGEAAAMQARVVQLTVEGVGDADERSRAALWRLAELQRQAEEPAAALASLERWQRAAQEAGESAAAAEPLVMEIEAEAARRTNQENGG